MFEPIGLSASYVLSELSRELVASRKHTHFRNKPNKYRQSSHPTWRGKKVILRS